MPLAKALATGVRSLSVVLLAGIGLSACQAILGDFEVDDSGIDTGALGTACEPGTFRCRDAELERCADNRRRFEPYLTCASAGECDPTAGSCHPCTAGEYACNDGVLELCGGDGAWTIQATCETKALCSAGMGRTAGTCAPPECDEGAFRCLHGRLEVCAPTRDRWELVEDCGSDERCSVDAAVAAVLAKQGPRCAAAECGDACPPAGCVPGETRCSSLVPAVELCGAEGQWLLRNACATDELCDGKSGRCLRPACDIGETRCLGQLRRTCSQDRTQFVDLEECLPSTTCTSTGCERTSCTDGEVRCNGVSFERCDGGAFVPMDRCATIALCSAAGCAQPTCGEDLAPFDCTGPAGQILYACRVGRDGWREIGTCASGQTCTTEHGCVQMP